MKVDADDHVMGPEEIAQFELVKGDWVPCALDAEGNQLYAPASGPGSRDEPVEHHWVTVGVPGIPHPSSFFTPANLIRDVAGFEEYIAARLLTSPPPQRNVDRDALPTPPVPRGLLEQVREMNRRYEERLPAKLGQPGPRRRP